MSAATKVAPERVSNELAGRGEPVLALQATRTRARAIRRPGRPHGCGKSTELKDEAAKGTDR
jgi:hypothetical protein